MTSITGDGLSNVAPVRETKTAAASTRFLDGLRGLAALYVVFHHASMMLLDQVAPGATPAPAHAAWAKFFSLFAYGRTAVIFFFVLSGFVIHLRYARALRADPAGARFGWFEYVSRRAMRLYPPVVLALLLTAALDTLGFARGWPTFTGDTPHRFYYGPWGADHGRATLLGNLLFVQSIYVPCYGTNGPLWSLTYEWWFYMVYPLLWWVTRAGPWRATALVALIGIGATFLPPGWWDLARVVLAALPSWWLGALLADIYTGRLRLPMGALTPLVLALPIALAVKDTVPLELQLFLTALAFTGFIALCFWLQQRVPLRPLDALKPLGDMSFTLYVIHLPIMIALAGWYMNHDPQHRVPAHPGLVAAGVAISLVTAYVCHLFVERPFVTRRRAAKAPQAA